MGQAESKRQGMPSIQNSPNQQYLSAHHPDKSKIPSPAKILLNVPAHRVRRKSVDTAFEEISKSFEEKQFNKTEKPNDVTLTPNPGSSKNQSKSPFLRRKLSAKPQMSEFNLPIVLPQLFESLQLPGRRSRRPSGEQGPINMKSILRPFSPSDSQWDDDGLPKIPPHEIFDPPKEMEDSEDEPQRFRGRASTIGNGQIPRLARNPDNKQSVVKNTDKAVKVPVVLRYSCSSALKPPSQVFVSGSMTDWKSVEMGICKGEKEFNLILDCVPGKYYYKFFVNNEWGVDENQPISSYMMRKPSTGKGGKMAKANVIIVKHEDVEVFEALACDSFAIRNIDKYSDGSWGQHKPKFDSQSLSSSSTGQAGPPILPPQLLNILLNKESNERGDPVLLPEPKSHVMLNHLYAQSIRDNLLVMASTTRYRKKCVTIVYYSPLDN